MIKADMIAIVHEQTALSSWACRAAVETAVAVIKEALQ
jgi:nucleoid DNA-binding protein